MKKLFVIVLAAIGMVSCMNTDEVIEVNNDNAIAFADAFIENSVRAEINNDNLTQFNVWGWMQEDAVEAPVFNAMEVTLSGADWTYSPAQYWVPGFTYTFKALSSNGGNGWVAAETTDGKLGEVTFTNVDGTEDLIYAAPAAVAAPALGTTAQPVELEFNHQLAKVKFDFEYAPELVAALELSGLTVKAEEITMKVPGKATIDYSATTPAWILDTTAAQTTLAFAKEGVERLTIPAGAAYEYDITFKVKYYQGTNVIKTIDKTAKISLAIEMGKAYNFTATITPDNLGLTTIDFETKVDGWDDAGAGFEPDAAPMAFVPAERTIYVNSAEQLLYLTELNAKWAELFSNGQGTEVTDFYTQNGGQGADYYYKWEWTIKLNADIDLKNITLNAPIDMRKWAFDGLGHTIKNVKIETATDVDTSAALFMGDGYTEFKDLKLENVHVKGSLVGNSTAAILVSDCSGASVENITITNSSVWGGKYTGGVVGYGYTSVNNCTLTNCVVKGGYKCGGVIGYICTSSANGKSVNNNTLTNCTVEGTDGEYAGGKSEYILGKVVGNFNCDGTCDNNKINNMTTSATANIGKVENGMTVNADAAVVVSTAAALNSAVDAGVKTIDATGVVIEGTSSFNHPGVTVIGATFKNENGIALRETIAGTFKDCVFEGSEAIRWAYAKAGETVVFENCVIKTDFRGFHFDGMEGDVLFKNCEINGFNAYGGEGTATFEGCTFGCDESTYAGLNIYSNTVLKDCTFNYISGKTNFIDLEGTGKTLSITGCTVTLDGAAANIQDYIGGSKKADNTILIDGLLPVSTADDFTKALSEGGNICLQNDLDITKIDLTTLTNDVVIDANGKTITTSSNYGIQVKAGKNITLKNAKIEMTVAGDYINYAAGFKVENGDYQGNTISLMNCEIRMCNTDWAYAVNMPASVKNLNLVIDGCTLEGALALQCWGDNNTITVTNSDLICNYTTSAQYTSYCVALQGDGSNNADNNTLNISNCDFLYSGVDNFNSTIKAVYNSNKTTNNTIEVTDCTYGEKVLQTY